LSFHACLFFFFILYFFFYGNFNFFKIIFKKLDFVSVLFKYFLSIFLSLSHLLILFFVIFLKLLNLKLIFFNSNI